MDQFQSWSILFSGVVAVSTVVYAVLTWGLVSETRKMRRAQIEPRISVIVQPREQWINYIDMVIQNLGPGSAHDIKFEVIPDFELMPGKQLSQLGFVRSGLKYLAPNQKLQFFFTNVLENAERKTATPLEIKVSYRDKLGQTYEDGFVVDFAELAGLLQLGKPPMYQIAANIEQIKNDISRFVSTFNLMELLEQYRQSQQEQGKQVE